MDRDHIPFNRPCLAGNEQNYIAQALARGHIAGDGGFTKKCQTYLETKLGVPKILLTTSCTHALEITALLLNIQAGDQIIVPSFTFVSSCNAFHLHGASPVFVDIRPDTLNLDETQLEQAITPRTKAIIAVHYAGVGCEMDAILAIAENHGITVVEDSAHGLFGKYKNNYLGTFGHLSTLSFHETKNFTCGEGGALLINDPTHIERAEIIREKGTNRSRFFRGEIDKYTWVDFGSSYLPADILAAFLYAQLEAQEQIQQKRKQIWHYYYEHLQAWAKCHDIQLPIVPGYCEQSYHMFYLLMPSFEMRQALINFLKDRGISSAFHYVPLHLSEMGRRLGGKVGDCPVTEEVSDRLLRLPFHNELSEADLARVVAAVVEFN